jgi:transcriptional regulator with XRE-family HTH domain
MAGKKTTNGPTGNTISENVKRMRESQNLTYAELSRRLAKLESPIPELGLRNIEKGQRKIDADELVALAHVLSTTPSMLLMPKVESPETSVTITGMADVPASEVWEWLSGGQGFKEFNFTNLVNHAPMWKLDVEDSIQSALELIGRIQEMQKDDRGDD